MKKHILVIVVTLGTLVAFPCCLAANESRDSVMDELVPRVDRVVCDDQVFLSRLNLNSKRCVELVQRVSEECQEFLEPLMPTLDLKEPDETYVRKMQSIGLFYGMCLRSSIVQSDL